MAKKKHMAKKQTHRQMYALAQLMSALVHMDDV